MIKATLPRVSFSQYNLFKQCPQSYNITYINPPKPEDEQVKIDSTFAMMGTYIQLLFETIVNNKLSIKDKNSFFLTQSTINELKRDLLAIMRTEIEFKNKQPDKDRPVLKHIKRPNKSFYIDKKYSTATLESLHDKIFTLFIENFNQYNTLPWDTCKCEVKVEKVTDTFSLLGFVDFLFFDRQENRFIMLDGKLNKNLQFATPEQLLFYVWGLNLKDRATSIGFWNYTLQEQKVWDLVSTAKVEKTINEFITEMLEAKTTNTFQRTPYQIGTIAGYCKYCPDQLNCPKVKQTTSKFVETDKFDLSNFI